MSRYLSPILSALLFFPVVAGVFTVPYIIHCYRKYGSVLFMRVLCVYSFILYVMCAYCLAILPFPDADTVVTQQVGINLIPFNYVPELLTKPVTFSISDPGTWVSALFASGLYEPLLNMVMFFPLGIFLRYYFGYGKHKTVLIALTGSLFLELTQLSATYGLAPFPYRVCDINDLMNNTFGAFLGYLCTPLFTAILPTRERLNQVSYQRGTRVSYVRRAFAFAIDFVIFIFPELLISSIMPEKLSNWGTAYILTVVLYHGLLPFLWQGKTPGNAIVRICMVDSRTGQKAHFLQYLARALMLHVCFLRPDLLFTPFLTTEAQTTGARMLTLGIFCLTVLCAIWHGIRNEAQMGYEEWTNTVMVSTVHRPDEPPSQSTSAPTPSAVE